MGSKYALKIVWDVSDLFTVDGSLLVPTMYLCQGYWFSSNRYQSDGGEGWWDFSHTTGMWQDITKSKVGPFNDDNFEP